MYWGIFFTGFVACIALILTWKILKYLLIINLVKITFDEEHDIANIHIDYVYRGKGVWDRDINFYDINGNKVPSDELLPWNTCTAYLIKLVSDF